MAKETRVYQWNEFDEDCNKIVNTIKKKKWDIKYVYGPPRGGVCLAVKLSHMLGIKYLPTLEKDHIERMTLVVDDVADTGGTLQKITNKFPYRTATIFIKPQTKFKPHIHCREVNNDCWIEYPWER